MFTDKEHSLKRAAVYMYIISFYTQFLFKKNIILRQNLIKIYTTTHQIAHIL